MRNLEIKCRCPDPEAVRRRVEALGARDAGTFRQHDTFFAATRGRLKLREFGDGTGELIAYFRPDTAEPRASEYHRYPTAAPERLRAVLAHALGVTGQVHKTRRVYLHRHTRIHLDEVDGLGSFVELETVTEGLADDDARAELESIAAALGLWARDRIASAYVDLVPGA